MLSFQERVCEGERLQLLKKLDVLPGPEPRALGVGFGQAGGAIEGERDGSNDNSNDFADVAATYILHPGDNRPYARVKFGDEFVDGLLDSGANVTVLGNSGYARVKRWELPIEYTSGCIRTADGTVRNTSAYVDIPYVFEGQMNIVRTYLLEHITQTLILGTDFWNAFRIEPRTSAVLELCELKTTEVDIPEVSPVSEPHDLTGSKITGGDPEVSILQGGQ